MMKKLASLILSLLLCLSLLPGQARADESPAPVDPPVIEEPVEPVTPVDPEDPEPPVMPMDDAPDGSDFPHL